MNVLQAEAGFFDEIGAFSPDLCLPLIFTISDRGAVCFPFVHIHQP